jgi:hypothetical protein
MSLTEAQDPASTATDLLAYDERQLVQYLKRNLDPDGGYDISGLVGLKSLSSDQRKVLAGKLK